MQRFVAIARERSLAYITLPEGETCAVCRVPDYLKDSYPRGGYFSLGSPLGGRPRGAVFLNADNYRAVTGGWVQLNAIHECYPGHHAQFAKTAAGGRPLSFKVGTVASRAAPPSEGSAVRTETLMQDVFDEPAFPLFVAYRRLHTAVRIWVDSSSTTSARRTPSTRRSPYVEQMRFPPHVARGQVYAQQPFPGVLHHLPLRRHRARADAGRVRLGRPPLHRADLLLRQGVARYPRAAARPTGAGPAGAPEGLLGRRRVRRARAGKAGWPGPVAMVRHS